MKQAQVLITDHDYIHVIQGHVEALIFRDHGIADGIAEKPIKRNSRFSAKTLITSKKHTLLSKQTFQRYFENRNGRYLTTLIFVSVTPN